VPRLPGPQEERDLDPRFGLVVRLRVLYRTGAKPDPSRTAAAVAERRDQVVNEVGPIEVNRQGPHYISIATQSA
jgi:hypothetical protein